MIKWLRHIHRGGKAEKLWQAGAGVIVFMAFVVMPVWANYSSDIMREKVRIAHSESPHDNHIQKLVYQKRMEWRKSLQEMNNAEQKTDERHPKD